MSGRGVFITLEGVDDAGKSTQAALLGEWLTSKKQIRVKITNEPGGTGVGEKLRELVLHGGRMEGETETLLMAAARREHIVRGILPALDNGTWVVCDRFSDSTFAYQGGGRGVCQEWIASVLRKVENGLRPDLTFYFNPPPLSQNSALYTGGDVFEREGEEFRRAVAAVYQERAAKEPERIVAVKSADGGGNRRKKNEIAAEIQNAVEERFGI